MSPCMDVFNQPRTESGESVYTQESGYAGLSSNLEHTWNEGYLRYESLSTVVEKWSSVTPIPRKGQAILECLEIPGVTFTCDDPSVEESAKGDISYGMGRAQWDPFYVSSKEDFPEQSDNPTLFQTVKLRSDTESNPGTETTKALPTGPSANEICPSKVRLASVEQLSKSPHINPSEGKNTTIVHRTNQRKRLLMVFLSLWLACLPVAEGFVVSPKNAQHAIDQNITCYTCKDIGCSNLQTIYDEDEVCIYDRRQNNSFPRCSTISPPAALNRSCDVCLSPQTNITIICSRAAGRLDVEGDGTKYNISQHSCPTMKTGPDKRSDQKKTPNRGRMGAIVSGGVYALILVAVAVCCVKD